MKSFIGCKIIRAEELDECSFLEEVKGENVDNRETRLGYLVQYPDGYQSWSPKEVFDSAYREVTQTEKDLII